LFGASTATVASIATLYRTSRARLDTPSLRPSYLAAAAVRAAAQATAVGGVHLSSSLSSTLHIKHYFATAAASSIRSLGRPVFGPDASTPRPSPLL